jgi:hypothetical protein
MWKTSDAATIAVALMLVASACSSQPPRAGADDPSASVSSQIPTASFPASTETQAQLGIQTWTLNHTGDSSVLRGHDSNGKVKASASLHWTDTAGERAIDIVLEGADVQWTVSANGDVAEEGLDDFRKNARAILFATRASADLPPPPPATTGGLVTTDFPVLVGGGGPPLERSCYDQFNPVVQDCMKQLICAGLTCGLRPFCTGRCLAG